MGNKIKQRLLFTAIAVLLTACMDAANDSADERTHPFGDNTQQQVQQTQISHPPPVQTDAVDVKGLSLTLWDNNGACQISDGKEMLYMKPMSPCYFVRVTGSLQLYQKGSTTVIAAVGTPVKQARCGQEVQGILIDKGKISISKEIGQGSIFCADKGLDGFHFSLF